MAKCKLRAANGTDAACDEDACIFWRVADHLDLPDRPESGCAVEYFGLMGESGSEIAAWLLSVKERAEREAECGERSSEAE